MNMKYRNTIFATCLRDNNLERNYEFYGEENDRSTCCS